MEWLKYLLEVNACTALFFGFYFLVLRRLTFFRFNRFYLLGTLLMSFIIPALQFNLQRELAVEQSESLPYHPELELNKAVPLQVSQPLKVESKEANALINWLELLPYVYGMISLAILFSHLRKLFVLLKYTTHYVKHKAGLKLVSKKTGFTNCSFFNYVFIDQDSLSEGELNVLIIHEQVHMQQFHSADKLLLMIIKALLWFNPFVYWYDLALEQVNEYEADKITSLSIGNHAYANLLLKLAINKTDMPLVLNLVKKPLKDRIKMLFNSKSTRMKKLVYLLALLPALGLVWLFAIQVVYAGNKAVLKAEKQVIQPKSHALKNAKAKRLRHNETKPVKIKENSVVKNNALVVPRIISFEKMTGDNINKVTLITNAVIEINTDILKAENVEWDRNTNVLKAKNAVLINRLEEKTIAKLFIADLKNGIYNSFSGTQSFNK